MLLALQIAKYVMPLTVALNAIKSTILQITHASFAQQVVPLAQTTQLVQLVFKTHRLITLQVYVLAIQDSFTTLMQLANNSNARPVMTHVPLAACRQLIVLLAQHNILLTITLVRLALLRADLALVQLLAQPVLKMLSLTLAIFANACQAIFITITSVLHALMNVQPV